MERKARKPFCCSWLGFLFYNYYINVIFIKGLGITK